VVRVYQYCDGTYLEDQDQWWLSGVFRDVHLLAFAATARIEDFRVQTLLDATYTNAVLKVDIDLYLETDCTVEVSVQDQNSSMIRQCKEVVRAQTSHLELELPFETPHKWTAETPYLICCRSRFARQKMFKLFIKVSGSGKSSYSMAISRLMAKPSSSGV
jgi:beta-galactosidase